MEQPHNYHSWCWPSHSHVSVCWSQFQSFVLAVCMKTLVFWNQVDHTPTWLCTCITPSPPTSQQLGEISPLKVPGDRTGCECYEVSFPCEENSDTFGILGHQNTEGRSRNAGVVLPPETLFLSCPHPSPCSSAVNCLGILPEQLTPLLMAVCTSFFFFFFFYSLYSASNHSAG